MQEITWKLYSPLTAEFFEKDEYGEIDYLEQRAIQFTGTDLTAYEDSVCEAVNRYLGRGDDLAKYIRDDCGMEHGVQINRKVLSAVPSVESVNGELVGCTTVRLSEPLNEAETDALCDYLTGQYSDGWGEGFEQQEIKVEDGALYVSFWNSGRFDFEIDRNPATEQEITAEQAAPPQQSENRSEQKYEITDIAHPEYPWLHRIRALRDIGETVRKGDLGGYVECEDNLSQQGNCWLFRNAISCENAVIRQNAVALDNAVIRGGAFVAGSARIEDRAVVEDNAIVMAGCIELNARISGYARISANPITNHFPLISQDAIVYGEVSGKVDICGHTVILPGAKIDMPTNDTLRIEDNKVSILRFEPNEQPKQKPRRSDPER